MLNDLHFEYSWEVIEECRKRKLDNALIGILDEQKGSIQYFDVLSCDVELLYDWDGYYWLVKDRENKCITKIKVTFNGFITKNEPFIIVKKQKDK